MSEAIGIVERLNDLRLAAFRAGGFDTPAAKAYYRALSTAFQRDELVDAAEISRLTARIAELEKALTKIESGSFPGATEMALTGNWKGIVAKLQEIARTTLEASGRGGGE